MLANPNADFPHSTRKREGNFTPVATGNTRGLQGGVFGLTEVAVKSRPSPLKIGFHFITHGRVVKGKTWYNDVHCSAVRAELRSQGFLGFPILNEFRMTGSSPFTPRSFSAFNSGAATVPSMNSA